TLGLAGVRTGAWAWTTEMAAAAVTTRTASQVRRGLTAGDKAASRNRRIRNLVDAGAPGVSGGRGAWETGEGRVIISATGRTCKEMAPSHLFLMIGSA